MTVQGYTTPGSITQQRQTLENEERLSTIRTYATPLLVGCVSAA